MEKGEFMAKSGREGSGEAKEARTGFLRRTSWRWASRLSLPRGWKRPYIRLSLLRSSIVDGLLFKIASAFELLALLAMLGFYFLCCGCSF
ncbi:uncharacterized protein LOC116248687 [Nymphaea colorata]|uniref:Uncharacterized protein n=1 Tax=Nymphaea colorata TaxID=210225 RepID=A0A5K0ZS99_9MAGN|nr:uncharacterized protein LOC116248687 [Nymphaea colorata]